MFRDEPAGAETGQPSGIGAAFGNRRNSADAAPTEHADGTRERRAERSSGSTTIAGLLAEALLAYQEESPEPPPAKPEPAPDNDFERLFDWRYQSPASGRHRSPE